MELPGQDLEQLAFKKQKYKGVLPTINFVTNYVTSVSFYLEWEKKL